MKAAGLPMTVLEVEEGGRDEEEVGDTAAGVTIELDALS